VRIPERNTVQPFFYHDEDQRQIAAESLRQTEEAGLWEAPIVTQLEPLKNFSPAENYHQDYYEKHQNGPYCNAVIEPKLKKLKEVFADRLRS